jgi:leader peptidase (prepilin peptidase)/N-methyltransferase
VKLEELFQLYAIFLGAVVGSFANVCIYRIPRQLSIVFPRSRCMRCGGRVAWYDNIPLLSYVWLLGRCRTCETPFGFRYLLVEAITAFVSFWMYRTYGLSWTSFYFFVLTVALLIVSFIDLDHRIIPNRISIPGTAIGLIVAAVTNYFHWNWPVTFVQALLGAVAGAGTLWGVGWLYERVTGREGIGFGDVKLLALFGAHTGIPGVLTSIFFGSLFGSIAGIALMVFQGKGTRHPIPFGPFLCLGLLVHAVGGNAWLNVIFRW